jgi:hypothetical protein
MKHVEFQEVSENDILLVYQIEKGNGKGYAIHKVLKVIKDRGETNILKTQGLGNAFFKGLYDRRKAKNEVTQYFSNKRTWLANDSWDSEFTYFKLDDDEILTLVSETI